MKIKLHDQCGRKQYRAIKAIRVLHESTTRLTRRRARAAFRAICYAVLKDYPPLDKTGKAKKRAKITCPICSIPAKSWLALAKHMTGKHSSLPQLALRGGKLTCPGCGKDMKKRALSAHLAGLARAGSLAGHFIKAAMFGFDEKKVEKGK